VERRTSPWQRSAGRDRDVMLGIEAGQVACPNRGILDIEVCFSCGRFRGVGGSSTEPGVRCAGRIAPTGLSLLNVLINPRS